MLNKLILF